MTDKRLIALIIGDIIFDIKDRRGIGNEWDAIDDDIKKEIKEEWGIIIGSRLNERSKT